jgi:hypothetical protein
MQQYEGMGQQSPFGGGGGGHPETLKAKLAAKLVLETEALLYGDEEAPPPSSLDDDDEAGENGGLGVLSGKAGKEIARLLAEGEKDDPDLYRVLGLSRRASAQAVKDSFRRLVLLVHPDKIGGPPPVRAAAAEAFQLVQEAYESLASPGERKKYDAYRAKLRRKRWRQRVRPVIDKLDEWGDYAEPFWRRRRQLAVGVFLLWALVL